MRTQTKSAGGHSTVITYDNHIMTESAASPLRRVIEAPFTRRAWNEVGYALASLALAIAALAFIVVFLVNGILWALSATGVRKFGAAARSLARGLLGEEIPAPPPIMPVHRMMVATRDFRPPAASPRRSLTRAVRPRVWDSKPGVTVRKLTPERVTELAAAARIPITSVRPQNAFNRWMSARVLEPVAWRTRGYFALKLPLAVIGLAVIVACWLGGVFCLTFPAWRTLGLGRAFGGAGLASLSGSFTLLPLGIALLLAGPWATRGLTEVDLWLMQGLLGPAEPGGNEGIRPRMG